ncbi:MAG: UDP-4-amino-4,6-dideoxy-N-acetyl-beta-L-altrosamine transaminase [Caulobacteraceae bacterium]
MADFLPYGRQTIEDDDIAAVAEALRSDFLTTGPRVEAFEAAICQAVDAPFAVACSNGTAALHLAMLAQGVGPGDVCIVPSITFLATANAARFVGAEVVFADVDPMSGLMTPDTLSDALALAGDEKVAAVLPVHLRGDLCDLPAIAALAEGRDAVVIEDACHALGSSADWGQGTERSGDGRRSAMACFSFHPVKTIATGEGGAVTTRDPVLAERLKRLRSHGMIRPQGGDPWWYEMPEVGFNYRIPDVLCALGVSQMAKLGRFVAARSALASRYQTALSPLAPLVRMAPTNPAAHPGLHLMVALIDFEAAGRTRAGVVEALRLRGVGSQVHYIPVHQQPYYRGRYGALDLPGAQAWYDRCLSLPLYPGMTEQDVDKVAAALAEALGINR